MACGTSKDSDQPGHQGLIRVFACNQRVAEHLRSLHADSEDTDQTSFCWFYHEAAHITDTITTCKHQNSPSWNHIFQWEYESVKMSQLMRLWYLSHRRPTMVQGSLHIRAVSPEPSLFVHIKYGSRRRVWPKIRYLAPLDGCACAFEEWIYRGQKSAIISWAGSYIYLISVRCIVKTIYYPRGAAVTLMHYRPRPDAEGYSYMQ